MTKTAQVFHPDKPQARKKLAYRISMLILIIVIGVLVVLIFNKYFKTGFFENLAKNLQPKETQVVNAFVSQVVAKIDPTYFKVFEAVPDERGDVIVTSEEGVMAHFSKNKDIDEQVYSLQTILLKARIEARRIKNIDLRFEKVYVEYQ